MISMRFFGSLLLIIGTSIGAGLLALPVVTAECGFLTSAILLVFCWFMMTAGALYLLETNLRLPPNSNMVSMAKHTLGGTGQVVTWVIYLLLLYALLAAYLSGGTDITGYIFGIIHLHTPNWLNSLVFLVILGYIVYLGLSKVDKANRVLMISKIVIFIILIALMLGHIQPHRLAIMHFVNLPAAIMVIITSFGFAIIVPSLRVYLHNDPKQLRRAIIAGSLIALTCYLLWLLIIQGSLSRTGQYGLLAIATAPNTISQLTTSIQHSYHIAWVGHFIHLFASICMLTSFLGVSYSMSDFLADGLGIKKQGKQQVVIYGVTFIPPLIIVLFFPGAFVKALSIAGVLCVLLLILLPVLMAWRARKQMSSTPAFIVPGGKPLIIGIAIIAIILIIIGIQV